MILFQDNGITYLWDQKGCFYISQGRESFYNPPVTMDVDPNLTGIIITTWGQTFLDSRFRIKRFRYDTKRIPR